MAGQAQRAASFSRGFPPVFSPGARVLILGSLPGARSLEARQYYAQPRNAFWRIMGALYGASPELAYEARLARLTEHGVALWDVLAAGQRPGSLDSAIVRPTAVTNEFALFFELNPSIRSICFNGAAAAELYRRKVLPALDPRFAGIARRTLPSTSPAHARMPFAEKLAHWSAALIPARDTGADRR